MKHFRSFPRLILCSTALSALGCGGVGPAAEELGTTRLNLSCPYGSAPAWQAGVSYAAGDPVTFNGILYECLQGHTAQAGWEPPAAWSLWRRPTPCSVTDWAPQTWYPSGSEATFNGTRYRSLQSHTSQVGWEPPNVQALWQVVQAPTCVDGKQQLASDLSVQYISRTPRFAHLKIDYAPDGYNPSLASENPAKQWPDPGDATTFTARIGNQGSAATEAVGYRWRMDGVVIGEGEIPGLASRATHDVELNWPWQDGAHTVRLELLSRACPALDDGHPVNDARQQPTNALLLTTYVWENFASWMGDHDNVVGTRSADDWIQYQADQMNALFASSTSELAPDGVRVRLAIDRIIRVPSNTPDPGGTHAPEPCPTDGCWGFGGPVQADWVDWINTYRYLREDGLLHEWGHQIGLIDLYNLDVQKDECRITEDGATSISSSSAGASFDRLFTPATDPVQSLVATYEHRPVWFAVVFDHPQSLSRMRMRFWEGSTHVWQVFSADTLEPAVAKLSPAVERSGEISTTGPGFGEVSFPAESAKVWLVHVERLGGDQQTHVTGWELYDGTSKLAIPDLLRQGLVAGTPLMPIVEHDIVRYNSIFNDLMSGIVSYELSPYHAWALNTDADWQGRGLPLRRGYFGKYLFEMPQQNALVVTRHGQPVAGASIEVFQQQDNIIPNIAKFVGTTDASGRFTFPAQTTFAYAAMFGRSAPITVQNPFSTVFSPNPHVVGINSVLVIRITGSDGLKAYRFLDVPQFNLEFARGHQPGLYPLEVGSGN